MKKNYIKPTTDIYHIRLANIVATSNPSIQLTSTNSNTEEDALVQEDSPIFNSVWEEEW